MQTESITSSLLERFAEVPLILCKDNANREHKSSLLERFAEVPLILCKDKYKNDNRQVFIQKSFIRNEHFS